jgi:hypothetical protein
MRRLLIIIALLLAIAPQIRALDTTELLGLVAMPLAVAAVSEASGVSPGDLGQIAAALNQADVPPTEFVQVIRYVPVTVVVQNDQPTFTQFIRDEVSSGVTGPRLIQVIDTRLRTYNVTPQFVTLREPATSFVLTDQYVVRTQPRDAGDLLALVAMPLAVNAVSNITGISTAELSNFMATMNLAGVRPVQIVEVLRYVPVALVDDSGPQFVQFVRSEYDDGLRTDALVDVVAQRLRTYDVSPQLTAPPRVIVVDEGFVPAVVTRRVAERRKHPHGGPPGQLKKELGVRTGAEVVHGAARTRDVKREREVKREKIERMETRSAAPPGQATKQTGKVNPGKGQGKGKGKGKG